MKIFILVRIRKTGDGTGKIQQYIGLFSSRERAEKYAQSIVVSTSMKFKILEESVL